MPPANATHLAAAQPPFLASAIQGMGWCESSKILLGDRQVGEGRKQKNIAKIKMKSKDNSRPPESV